MFTLCVVGPGRTPTQSITLCYSGNQARISELINLFSQHPREKESCRHIQPIRSMIKRLLEGANWKSCEGAESTISLPLMTAAFHGFLPPLLKVLYPAHTFVLYKSFSLHYVLRTRLGCVHSGGGNGDSCQN